MVKNDGVTLTYSEVYSRAKAMADYITRQGIGAGDVVAVLADRNENMLPATLGVLLAGAAYEPLDPTYPAERLQFMMEDAGVKLLLKDAPVDLEAPAGVPTFEISKFRDIEISKSRNPESQIPIPNSPFIILYTSGTTGKPKGVVLTHANLMALWGVMQRQFPETVTPDTTWAMYASYGFDAGFFSLLMPVLAGAAVSIVPEDLRLDMEGLNDFFSRNGVDTVLMTTQVGRIFATTVEKTTLRTLFVGGEKLVPLAPPRGYTLYNLYGPTEGTVFCNAQRVDKLYSRVPIGQPLDDYRDYIVDTLGRLMPLGALGELVIAGPQVGAGYLNRPEKTAEVFIKNPFCDEPEYARAYRTGDIVRILPGTGAADIIGRNDGQVKVRGFRVELAEIEQVVREFPGITDATVQAFDAPTGGKFVAAYVVSDAPVDVAALCAFIAERKPPYMVPEVTMQIDAIPLTQNHKVNKRALPEPVSEQRSANSAPRKANVLERAIQEVVGEVLKMPAEEVALDTPLAYLGLTSIVSIRLASALYKRFDIPFKGAELVKSASVTTIEDQILQSLLTKSLETLPFRGGTGGASGLRRANLTSGQQGVYADTMRNPGTTSYNIPVYFRLSRDLQPDAVAEALGKVLDAHPYLRDVHLRLGEEDVEQTVEPRTDRNPIKVKQMTETELRERLKRFIRPFDLMKAPLCRFEVVGTEEATYLLMDVQHIVFDGSSLTVMMSQLKTILEGDNIEPEKYTYLDYAASEREWLEGDTGREAADFFKNMLANCEAASDLQAPTPVSPPQTPPQGEGLTKPEQRSRVVTKSLIAPPLGGELRGAAGASHAALMLAATCYATARFTTSRSAFISTISSGRADVRFADTFGMFVKTLPFAMTIGEGSASDYVMKADEQLRKVVEREMYPYSRICADYNYSPNIVYEYQIGVVDDFTIEGKKAQLCRFDVDTLKFKIAVRVEEVDGQPCLRVHYRPDLYTEEFINTFADSILQAAREMVENPEQPIRHLSLVTSEQEKVLEQFAFTELTEPASDTFHGLMQRQARLHPDRTAVVASDRTLTYAELDRLSDIVAMNLQDRRIGRGDRVVLVLSRSSRFFTTLYGVLKAGAAYVPSSPEYPEERIRTIAEDSGAKLLVTDDNVEELHQSGARGRCPAPVEVSPDDTVYIIYTSGTTGKPKGVVLRHRGVVNYVTPAPSVIHSHAVVERCTVCGSITTVAFDMAIKEWGLCLSNGLTVVFAEDAITNDPVALAKLFADNKVDYFNTTPSRMQQYMELDAFADMLRACKVIICGAEKYPEHLVEALRHIAPEAEIFNTYGPTEITVSSNAACLTHNPSVSVGRPLRNYIEHIVDLDDNLLPPGAVGELLIGGWNIGAGYNNNPEQTARAFIDRDGVPTYRSGDYARWTRDGCVTILGRKDTQVKLRGLRIELGEIERVMGELGAIAACHVMVRKIAGREHLVTYYTLRPGTSMTQEEITSRLGEKLTDYMVPSVLMPMDAMPLTPNGKINVRALPEPVQTQRERGGAKATNETEQLFIDTFKKILGLDEVYADDNFFTLGGTSLTATRIMIAASKAGHQITYADVFANPTPQQLAALLAPASKSRNPGIPKSLNPEIPESRDSVDAILAKNTLDAFRKGNPRRIGTVMLTGATGFAGIHVLRELMTATDSQVVCLLRDSRTGVPAAERIEQLYFYYFGESLAETFPGRVSVVRGDITSMRPDFDPGCKVDTIINCAANVKHFSAGTDIEDVNYHGVLNLIEWAKAHGHVCLLQTSTISITGFAPEGGTLTEQSLDIGQEFGGNKYITSKFMAERAVLEAAARGDIVGKIVRLGNLAPRERDGEFQINFRTNGFMNRLRSMVLVGCYPYDSYSRNKDISPIDSVARAIVLFAGTPEACTVLHGNNPNRYSLGNFYHLAAEAGLPLRPVEADEFAAAIDRAKEDPDKLPALVGLMAYEGMGSGLKPVEYSNDHSCQLLLRLGMHWPAVSPDYVRRLVRALSTLAFFS